MTRLITIIVLAISTLSCSAQSVCEKLEQLKKLYYGFKPSLLKPEQRNAKSADLDKFWDYAKSNKTEAVPCLINMIKTEQTDTYFCFDASSLLLTLDKEQQHLDAVLEGVKKSDIIDLNLEGYLQISFFLGSQGKDISSLAEKLISYPNAKIPLTIHAITLNAIEAASFLYNKMDPSLAEQSLSTVIMTGNSVAKHNAAILLTLNATAKGDSLLNRLIANKNLADSTIKIVQNTKMSFTVTSPCDGSLGRTEILEHLKSSPTGEISSKEMMCSAVKVLLPEDIEVLREARRKSTPGLSDEGLERYFALTIVIITLRNQK